jgi:hypothetical protein
MVRKLKAHAMSTQPEIGADGDNRSEVVLSSHSDILASHAHLVRQDSTRSEP